MPVPLWPRPRRRVRFADGATDCYPPAPPPRHNPTWHDFCRTAVLDESQLSNGYTNGVGERTTNTTTATTNIGSGHYTPVATPDAVQRLRSQPLDSYMVNTSQESDGFGGAAGGITDITPPYLQGGPQHSQHGLPPMPGHPQAASSSAGMHGAASAPGPLATLPSGTYRNGNASMGSLGSIRERTGSLNSMQHALVATQGGGGGGGGGGLGHHGLGHCLSMGAGGMAQVCGCLGMRTKRLGGGCERLDMG